MGQLETLTKVLEEREAKFRAKADQGAVGGDAEYYDGMADAYADAAKLVRETLATESVD